MDLLSYHILFNQKVFPLYDSFTDEEKQVFVYTAFNETMSKEYAEFIRSQLIQEWTLPVYTPLFSLSKMYLHSPYFHLAKNPQLLQRRYIGFGMCDHKINVDDFRKVLSTLQSTSDALCGSVLQPIKMVFEPLPPNSWEKIIIEPMNRLTPTEPPLTLSDVIRHPIFLMNTFIVPTPIFIEMMNFIETNCLRVIMQILHWNPEKCTSILERCMGLYLAICCHQKRFSTVVQYKIEQYKEPVYFEEDPIDESMSPRSAAGSIYKALLPLEESLQPKGKKTWFISFGNEKYKECVKRIEKEAQQFTLFQKIKVYQPDDLKDTPFWKAHGEFIQNNPTGYGYWIWKPYIVLRTLEKMKDEDILVYADAGCTIHSSGRNRFMNYLEIVRKSPFGILTFQLQHELEKMYTKLDTLYHFRGHSNARICNTTQIIATAFVIRKCEHTMKIVQEWYKAASNYHLLDDSPSVLPNDPIYKTHKHDQSLFSILVKKHGAEYLQDETFPIKPGFPILATRHEN